MCNDVPTVGDIEVPGDIDFDAGDLDGDTLEDLFLDEVDPEDRENLMLLDTDVDPVPVEGAAATVAAQASVPGQVVSPGGLEQARLAGAAGSFEPAAVADGDASSSGKGWCPLDVLLPARKTAKRLRASCMRASCITQKKCCKQACQVCC